VVLRQTQVRALLTFLEAGEAVAALADFPRYVVEGLPALVPCDSISYNEVDTDPPRLVSLLEPAELRFEGDAELWARFMHQHPLVASYIETGDGRAIKLSDFLSRREYHKLELYSLVYRRLRTEYQMSVGLPAPRPLVVGIALNRERRDFSERDRELLDLARPHLARLHRDLQARRNAEGTLTALQRAVEAGGQGVVLLEADGRPALVSARAAAWLEAYFGAAPGRLPRPVAAWLEGWRRSHTAPASPPPAEPLLAERDGARLVVRFVPALRPTDRDLLLLEEQAAVGPAGRGLGLTPREHEVLEWVARGKRSAEIARLLGVRRSTVEKHLEHIYAKLGVHGRTAAVARALRLDEP
jgi:DNA-binding CsgD family transcriptional regulator